MENGTEDQVDVVGFTNTDITNSMLLQTDEAKHSPLAIPFRGYSLGERIGETDADLLLDDDFDIIPSNKAAYDTKDIEALNVQTSSDVYVTSNNKLLIDAQERLEQRASNYIRSMRI